MIFFYTISYMMLFMSCFFSCRSAGYTCHRRYWLSQVLDTCRSRGAFGKAKSAVAHWSHSDQFLLKIQRRADADLKAKVDFGKIDWWLTQTSLLKGFVWWCIHHTFRNADCKFGLLGVFDWAWLWFMRWNVWNICDYPDLHWAELSAQGCKCFIA